MKLVNIISEIEFFTYVGMVQIVYQDISSVKMAELIRALPGVTTVTLATDMGEGKEVIKVKLISQKSGKEAFQALKDNAMKKYPPIKLVKVGENTIEKK
jgi:hypothetical protein